MESETRTERRDGESHTTDEVRPARDGPSAALTERIIGCAIEVHRELGPGLLESAYESALCVEFESAGLEYKCQVPWPVLYKGKHVGDHRIDVIVEKEVVVEVKSAERFDPVFEAQILTYLRITGLRTGLLINFNSRLLRNGIRRFVL